MTEIHEFHLPITTEKNLRAFLRYAFGVVIPNTRVCDHHCTPWRAFSDAYFARSSMAVWKASRGLGGKTYLLALLALVEAVTLKADVKVLGGSGEQSENVHRYVQGFWSHPSAPTVILLTDPSKRETKLAWGNTVHALLASQRSVRGPHPQRLRLDEIDEMDLAIFDAAMGQTMATVDIPAQTVASSTHQYASGTMTEVLKRANDRGWPVYEWCYRETSSGPDGWLMTSEIARKRSEVTEAMWQVEYDLQEPSPESRAIQPEKVELAFLSHIGKWAGGNGEYIEIEPPDPDGSYATGADWARKKDFTVIKTMRVDVRPVRLVAFERCQRLPWPVMIAKFNERVKRYPGSAAHDGTGLGDVVDGYIEVDAEPMIMVGRKRADMISNYVAAIERGDIVAPRIEFDYNEHKYASVDDLYGSGHLPDTIAAGALTWHAAFGIGETKLGSVQVRLRR